jgi:hypothetical protein
MEKGVDDDGGTTGLWHLAGHQLKDSLRRLPLVPAISPGSSARPARAAAWNICGAIGCVRHHPAPPDQHWLERTSAATGQQLQVHPNPVIATVVDAAVITNGRLSWLWRQQCKPPAPRARARPQSSSFCPRNPSSISRRKLPLELRRSPLTCLSSQAADKSNSTATPSTAQPSYSGTPQMVNPPAGPFIVSPQPRMLTPATFIA